MTTKRKPQRPRLEIADNSRVYATVPAGDDERLQVTIWQAFDGESVTLAHRDIKRLHSYLGRVLEYNAHVKRKKGGAK